MTQVNVDPIVLQQLTDRQVMPKDQFLELPDELRLRAFTIARQTDADVLQQTLDALHQTVETGGTLWDFRQNFPEIAAPYTDAGRDSHLNLVFQQNVRQARAVGAYQARQRVKTAFPYVEYITGPNPRPSHAALDTLIFDIDDPFLLSHTPPWDFGCNCDLIPRTAAQVGIVAAEDATVPPEEQRVVPNSPAIQGMLANNHLPDPVSGAIHPVSVATPTERGGEYSFRPDRLNQPVDLTGYDPAIRDALIQALDQAGYRVSADGTTAVPTTPPLPPPASTHKFRNVGRPSASKAGRPASAGSHSHAMPFGMPICRVSRPAPQIARISIAQYSRFKEAA